MYEQFLVRVHIYQNKNADKMFNNMVLLLEIFVTNAKNTKNEI